LMIRDADAKSLLVDKALDLIVNLESCNELNANIVQLGRPNAANEIANEVIKLISKS